MKTALILVDIQNDYFPGGRMELAGSEAAGQKAAQVLKFFREKGLPVFHIQHLSVKPGASFFIPGTEGVKIHSCVTPAEQEPVIEKNFPNSFRDTVLLEKLRDLAVERIVVAGMMTQMCIDTTVRAAFDLGFACTLLHDACATREQVFGGQTVPADEVQAAFMAAIGSVFATVVSTDEYIFSA